MEKQGEEMQILRGVVETQKDEIQKLKKSVLDKENILLSSYMDTEKTCKNMITLANKNWNKSFEKFTTKVDRLVKDKLSCDDYSLS